MAQSPARGLERILIVRLGSMGDIVHAMPAVRAMRAANPDAQIDWLVESKWRALVECNPDVSNLIELDRSSFGEIISVVRQLRSKRYDCAIDLQGLYKSAVITYLSGTKKRIGFAAKAAREGGAARFYTERLSPARRHVIEQNVELAGRLGATDSIAFPAVRIGPEAEAYVSHALAAHKLESFYVISPGGGWRSKCWPPEQFGHLHRKLAESRRIRAIISYGPGEKALAESVRVVAGESTPVPLGMNIAQLMALLRRAKFVVAGDTGPLHLAAALGTPVIALFGPTDPLRNGPVGARSVIVRNATDAEATYKRGDDFSAAMRSIRVEQVVEACEKILVQQN